MAYLQSMKINHPPCAVTDFELIQIHHIIILVDIPGTSNSNEQKYLHIFAMYVFQIGVRLGVISFI